MRVGVIGSTSTVARLAVIPALGRSRSCELVATASQSDPGATYADYASLVEAPEVEAVYIPLPNSLHREWAERCASAGKHVLCEKPLAPSAPDALAIAVSCAEAEVVLMEAYMTQFHPRDRAIQRLVADGALGELLFGRAAFTGVLDRPDDHRWHAEMGGGALLDVGIYCLTPLLAAAGVELGDDRPDGRSAGAQLGDERGAGAGRGDGGGAARRRPPVTVTDVRGVARMAGDGVDASFAGWLEVRESGSGRPVALSFECSFEAPGRQQLSLIGTEGTITIDRAFTPGPDDTEVPIVRRSGATERIETGGADPYLEMVDHFGDVVRGDAELVRPPGVSAALQRLVDRLRMAARV